MLLTTNKPQILIGSPIRQSPDILAKFLLSLSRLDYSSFEPTFYFIDDNDQPASSELLQSFADRYEGSIIDKGTGSEDYIRNDLTHYWNEHLIWKVAAYKDTILRYAVEQGCDGVFLIDSDLLLHPATVGKLLEADVDIVSEIFWTRWQPNAALQPQVWLKDEYTQWEQHRGEKLEDGQVAQRYQAFINKLQRPGLYEVGGLGACTFISKHALQRGVSFKAIPNLSFWGEDRHFCIRAAALGLSLHVDTHYPAYHIYRSSDLAGADDFIRAHIEPTLVHATPRNPRPTLTLSMVIRNEASRYLRQVLQAHSAYIGQAVIIDDGSTDESVEVVMEALRGIPVRLVRNRMSRFRNEVELRKQQWEETLRVDPVWILNMDADELLEDRFVQELDSMLNQQDIDLFCFRLYDFWNETHYRDDAYWQSHNLYRPFLLRYRPDLDYQWKETPQHCGRFPENVFELPHHLSPVRVKHMGWAKESHRLEKWLRYKELDPDAAYGWPEQYDSILDPDPNLIEWIEWNGD
jgi:hypothetical protein